MFTSVLFTVARTGKQPKCPPAEEWIKKVGRSYAREYHSATKRNKNPALCRDVNEPRDCHTEWIKSEREKQISYINRYTMWNLENRYRWTCLQSGNRDTDIENKCVDIKGGEVEWHEQGGWGCHINIYTEIKRKSLSRVRLLVTP